MRFLSHFLHGIHQDIYCSFLPYNPNTCASFHISYMAFTRIYTLNSCYTICIRSHNTCNNNIFPQSSSSLSLIVYAAAIVYYLIGFPCIYMTLYNHYYAPLGQWKYYNNMQPSVNVPNFNIAIIFTALRIIEKRPIKTV